MENQQAVIDSLVAEKTALDQSYVQEIRNCLELRKQHLMKDKYIQDLTSQINSLLQEKTEMQSELEKVKAELKPVSEPEAAPIIE